MVPPMVISRKVLRRFYEPLLLLNALGQIRGSRIKRETNSETNDANITKHQRAFADGLAYICSHRKEPDDVTATALEKTETSTRIWLAANKTISSEVIDFLTGILGRIQRAAAPEDKGARQIACEQEFDQAIGEILEFNKYRIEVYFRKARRLYQDTCQGLMQEELSIGGSADIEREKALKLMDWLSKHFAVRDTPEDNELYLLAREIHSLRSTFFFEPLKAFEKHSQTDLCEFEQLFRLLFKLGKHVTITRKLFEAAVTLSSDFARGFTIEVVPSSKQKSLPLTPKEASLESTIRRMFANGDDQDAFRRRLSSLWSTEDLSGLLEKERNTKTRVHAELLLIDHLEYRGCNFLGGADKYIGCSKPACYLCHAYISNHPGGYTIPGSHQKLYIGWRIPDVSTELASYQSRLSIQESILRKLIVKVRQDLQLEMESNAARRPYHEDSTAGATTEVGSRLAAWFNGLSIDGPQGGRASGTQSRVSESPSNGASEDGESQISDDEGGVPLN